MISAVDISLNFGAREIFDDISFRIGPHDRIGLVGSNGAGKTTLLRLLVGEVTPTGGEIGKAKYVSVGYLPQEGMHSAGRTLYKEVETVFGDVLQVQERLDQVHKLMGELNHETDEFKELLELQDHCACSKWTAMGAGRRKSGSDWRRGSKSRRCRRYRRDAEHRTTQCEPETRRRRGPLKLCAVSFARLPRRRRSL